MPTHKPTTAVVLLSPGEDESGDRGWLVVLRTTDGRAVGSVVELSLSAESIVGRSEEAIVVLDDNAISRRHLAISRSQDGGWLLKDFGSRNGTFINGQRVSEQVLRDRDVITLAETTDLRFTTRDPSKDEEIKLRQAVAAGELGTWQWNGVTGRLTASSWIERLFNVEHGTLSDMQKDLMPFIDEADRASVREALSRAVGSGGRFDQQFLIVGPRGQRRWVAARGNLLGHPSARVVGGTLLDETAQKTREEALRRDAVLLENLADGVMVLDARGHITDWNEKTERLVDRRKSGILGQPLASLFICADPARLTEEILHAIAAAGRWTGELRLTTPSGAEQVLETVVLPLCDGDGREAGLWAALRNVTNRKQMEARLQIAERMFSLGTLAAGVGHEINNPLAFLSSNLSYVLEVFENLHDAPLDPQQREELVQALRESRQGADRIRRIVQDLQTFSRSGQEGATGPIDAGEAAAFALRMCEKEIRHRAGVIAEIAPECTVRADESRLGQVLVNLLMNAAQAIPEGASERHTIKLRCFRSDSDVVLEVEDTGCGIPASHLSRIFEPFFTTKDVGKGTGLGLSVSHGLVTAMGGKLTARSTVGHGSCFRIELPALQQEPRRAARAPNDADKQTVRRARILVIDDEPMIGHSMRRVLARDHEVVQKTSAEDALRAIRGGERFDVIFCDLMMPKVTGMDLYAELSRTDPDCATRMIFMTGGVFTAGAQTFADSAGGRLLVKPVEPGAMREAILDVLRCASP